MEYANKDKILLFKEYGRNIQKLVQEAIEIEDDVLRKKVADGIIDLMTQLTPHVKSIDDYRHKLWDHLQIMSDFKLNVVNDYPLPEKEKVLGKSDVRMEYPTNKARFRHYGKNVEEMIETALKIEDTEKQQGFAEVIGNYMKMVYQNWNKENVTDDTIINDMKFLSKGKLNLPEDFNLDSLGSSNRTRKTYSRGRTGSRSNSSTRRRKPMKGKKSSGGSKRRNYRNNGR